MEMGKACQGEVRLISALFNGPRQINLTWALERLQKKVSSVALVWRYKE